MGEKGKGDGKQRENNREREVKENRKYKGSCRMTVGCPRDRQWSEKQLKKGKKSKKDAKKAKEKS